MNRKFWYLCCHSCQHKQYIGADLQRSVEVAHTLVGMLTTDSTSPAGNSLVGLGSSLLLAMKFLRLHDSHQISLWNIEDGNPAVESYPEEWPYDTERKDFITKVFEDITPLGVPADKLKSEIEYWRSAYQKVQVALFDLQTKQEAITEGERLQIQRNLREFVETEMQARLVGPNAVETEEVVGIELDPRMQKIQEIAEEYEVGE